MPEKAASVEHLSPEAMSCRLNRHDFPDEETLPYEVYDDGFGMGALRKVAYCRRGCMTKRVTDYVEHIRDGYETIDRVGRSVLDYSETHDYLLAKGNGPADIGRLRYLQTYKQLPKAPAPAVTPEPKKAKPRKATADPFVVEPDAKPARKATARKATRPLARKVATR